MLKKEKIGQQTEAPSVSKSVAKDGMLRGTVIDIEDDMVIVSTYSKSEDAIPKWQFLNNDGELEVAIGDEIEVALDLFEDGLGATLLSRDKAKKNKAWSELETAFEKDATIIGRITGKVRGGFTVSVGALRAFLPKALVDVRPIRDTTFLENRDLEFKVIKIDQKRNNVVLSRRAVVEKEYSAETEELQKTLEEGAIVIGVVKNLTDYGAFIDLGGIDGLLHVTDMAWRRVRHPSECVEIGQEIKVKVLKYDKDKNRVSLGMKQMGEDPWQNIARRYPAGTRVFGKVNNLTDYGCFVEIEEGVEGLVHGSEMDWTNKNVNPSKLVQLGEEVEVMVLEIDEERRRISLGMKQCKTNPWDEFAATHNKGDKISGKIKSITDFGIFIGLDGGIDGLVHMSDISWADDGEASVREFKKGDELETVILAVDSERELVSLGIKQLEQNSFQNNLSSVFEIEEVGRLNSTELGDRLTQINSSLAAISKNIYSNGIQLRFSLPHAIDIENFCKEIDRPIKIKIRLDHALKVKDSELLVDENIGTIVLYQSGELRSIGQIESVNNSSIKCIIDDALDMIDPGAEQYTDQKLVGAFFSDITLFAMKI